MVMRRPSSEEPVITPTHLTPDVLDQLREADAVVNEELANHDLMRKISQVPVVLIPLPMDEPVVRPLHTTHTARFWQLMQIVSVGSSVDRNPHSDHERLHDRTCGPAGRGHS